MSLQATHVGRPAVTSLIRLYVNYGACASCDACYDLLYDDLWDAFFYDVNRALCLSVFKVIRLKDIPGLQGAIKTLEYSNPSSAM